jgi:hypothetical protein
MSVRLHLEIAFAVLAGWLGACGGNHTPGAHVDARGGVDAVVSADAVRDSEPASDASSVVDCAPGRSCSNGPQQFCGTFDGQVARACSCVNGSYTCKDTGSFQIPCSTPAPTGPCIGPESENQTLCVSTGSAGCLMTACGDWGGSVTGTWSGVCELVCPSAPPPCGAGCAPGTTQSCGCEQDGVSKACACVSITSTAGVWVCM